MLVKYLLTCKSKEVDRPYNSYSEAVYLAVTKGGWNIRGLKEGWKIHRIGVYDGPE